MNIHCQQALLTYVVARQIAAETEPVPVLRQRLCVDVRRRAVCECYIIASPAPYPICFMAVIDHQRLLLL